MNGLFEILSNKEWMIQQEFLHSILPTLQYNITNHATLGIDREKKSPMAIGQQGQDFIREYQVTQDGMNLSSMSCLLTDLSPAMAALAATGRWKSATG